MAYAQALDNAWNELISLHGDARASVQLLADTYDIDDSDRTVLSLSCNVPAKDHVSIITLHYLIRKLRSQGLPPLTGEWVDFNQLEGGFAYYPTFKKRTIDHIARKYGSHPETLLKAAERLPAKEHRLGDASLIVYPFAEVPIVVAISKADDEFAADANILFDRNIPQVFCTEDIVVLTEITVHSL